MVVKSLKCSGLHTREIYVPNCINGQPCKRVYHIFLPRILCHGGARRRRRLVGAPAALAGNHSEATIDDVSVHPPRYAKYDGYFEGTHVRVGTLPLAFLLHGFGSDAASMMNFASLADHYHFVIVLPEGLENSFNAGDCCGYALLNGIDDVAFLSEIQSKVTGEFGFLKPNFSYGVGHNNGAFLLTYALERAPHMFQSIVPISGYTHRVDQIRNRLGVGGKGIGIMIHHSLDDFFVRPSGCCQNSRLPKCEREVESDYCMPVLQIFDLWAKQINACDLDAVGGSVGSDVIGEIGGVEYTLSYEDESKNTVLSLMMTEAASTPTVNTLFKSDVPVSVGYAGPNGDVTCLTSPSCVANSTLCLHSNGGDFNKDNDFGKEFPLVNEVNEFVAREACGANDGMLEVIPGHGNEKAKHVCACFVTGEEDPTVDFGGAFCMDALNADGTFKAPSSSHNTNNGPGGQVTHIPPSETSYTAELPNDVADSPQEGKEMIDPPASASDTLPEPVANDSAASSEPPKQGPDSPQKQNESIEALSASDTSSNPVANESAAPLEPPKPELNSQQNQIELIASLDFSSETPSETVTEPAAPQELPKQEVDSLQKQSETVVAPASASESSLNPVVTDPSAYMKQNETIYNNLVSNDSVKPGPAMGMIIFVSFLLALLAILGVALRRRWERKKKLAIIAQYQDDELVASGLHSPYRDYFRRGNNGPYGEYWDDGGIGACELPAAARYSDSGNISGGRFEIGREKERRHPYRYGGETEMVNRSANNSNDDIGGGTDIAGWADRLPYRYRGADMSKQEIMDDYSFNIVDIPSRQSHKALPESRLHAVDTPVSQYGRSKQHTLEDCSFNRDLDGLDDSSIQSQRSLPERLSRTTKPQVSRYDPNRKDVTKQQIMDDYGFHRTSDGVDDSISQRSLPESLLHATGSSATYLDLADRNMLRQFREQSRRINRCSHSEIIRRRSERSDPDSGVSMRDSYSEPVGDVDALDEDLEKIESEIM